MNESYFEKGDIYLDMYDAYGRNPIIDGLGTTPGTSSGKSLSFGGNNYTGDVR